MNEYRCTRSTLYAHNCIGRDNLSARQGHYIEAENEAVARQEMAAAFPQDLSRALPLGIVPFTVTLHKELP